MSELTTAFAGSPMFAATILKRLVVSKYAPELVLTQPDRPAGRNLKVKANAVKLLAKAQGLAVFQPTRLSDPAAISELTQYRTDLLIVAAYGLILPPAVLALPRFGCINVHASLLPRWRGAAPIERAIMAGDHETGVCIMKMEAGLDTGPVYASETVSITPTTPVRELEKALAKAGAKQLIEVLKTFARVKAGEIPEPQAIPQDDTQATYAHKLTAADRIINWQQSAEQITRQITALAERLPVRTRVNDCVVQFLHAHWIEQTVMREERLAPGTLIDTSKAGLTVQCATDLLQITSIKIERGKGKTMDAASAINGFKDLFYPGARFIAD